MSISFSNYSMPIGQRYEHDWYDWCVFACGDESELSEIARIEYTLHPSFPEPVRVSSDRQKRFAVMSNGWGGFLVNMRVILLDGKEEVAQHMLRLQAGWPTKVAVSFDTTTEKSIYEALSHPSSRWKTVDGLVKRTNISAQSVSAALRALEDANLARLSPIPSISKKDLWGSTTVVGISPTLR